MIINLLKQCNWVDIVIVILLLRVLYIPFKSGLGAEFFKLLGTVIGIYLAFHYAPILSDWLAKKLPVVNKAPVNFVDFVCFLVLAIIGYLVSVGFRLAFNYFVKAEMLSTLRKYLALALAAMRGVLLVSLIIFAFFISGLNYAKKSILNSYLSKYFFQVSPNTYKWIWDNVTSKFMINEKFNDGALELEKIFRK